MARGAKAQAALRKQKDARQKKMLIALAPVLLGMLAWQGPGILKAFSGSPPPPAPVATPASATAPTATDPVVGGAPSTAAPGAAAAPVSSGPLPNTDEPAPPDEGQLVSFDRFVGKDPFRQQVDATEATDVASQPTTGAAGGGTGDGSANPPGVAPPPAVVPPAVIPPADGDDDGGSPDAEDRVATLDVNGTSQAVTIGSTFPTAEPIFRLVSLKARSVKIGLVAGEFSTGVPTITLRLRKAMTLVSQPDGIRYTITLRRVA